MSVKKGTKKSRQPNEVDKRVGAWIRVYREDRGISQGALAAEVGITFQQIQKYESGINRVSAGTLFYIARALGRPIEAFFEGA